MIVSGSNSLHSYNLRPSDARALQGARVVFWVGPALEAFLQKPLDGLAGTTRVVTLADTPGLQKLPVRAGNGFDADDDGDSEAPYDGHVFLDPENAIAMVAEIARVLVKADPDNAKLYAANAETETKALRAQEEEIAAKLKPVAGKSFILFHDSLHYFEKRFGVHAAGVIAVNPEVPPGAAGLRVLKDRIKTTGVRCVFAEPSFDHRLTDLLVEKTGATSGVIDAEGALLDQGLDLYAKLLDGVATSLTECLSQ